MEIRATTKWEQSNHPDPVVASTPALTELILTELYGPVKDTWTVLQEMEKITLCLEIDSWFWLWELKRLQGAVEKP